MDADERNHGPSREATPRDLRETEMVRTLLSLYANEKGSRRHEAPKEAAEEPKKGRRPSTKLASTTEEAERLSDVLVGSELTVTEMANACGVSKSTASRWLKDPARIPLDRLFDVADALGINWEALQQALVKGNPAEVLLPGFFLGGTEAPCGALGLLYAYCALPERDRNTLAALAAHLLRAAEEGDEANADAGSAVVEEVSDIICYDADEAERGAFGPTGWQVSTTSADEATDALLRALPEVDRMAYAKCSVLRNEGHVYSIGS